MEGQLLGPRLHIDWAIWDAGLARSVHRWLQMRALHADFLAKHYDIGRGVRQRIAEIDVAIPR